MRVLDIFAKDVHAVAELSRDEVKKLILFLDNCEHRYAAGDEANKAAGEFVKNKFYPDLVNLKKLMGEE